MAEIYRATDTALGRDVAVKVLTEHATEDEDLRARFLREALAAARLSGEPHTVSIYDVGERDGRPFLVMEYLAGGSLAEKLGNGHVSRSQALLWLEQAARALDSAHAHGVVQRDVKPANLLLDGSGNLHVADFGIARTDGLESNTQAGAVLGTAGYLAPEQQSGARATAASDLYALAVVAFELLTGSSPHANPSRALPPAANAVFARALAVDPADRYESCLELVAALQSALTADEQPTVVVRRRRRAPVLLVPVLVLGALAAGLAVGLSVHRGKSSPPALVIRTVTTTPATPPARPVAAVVPSTSADKPTGKGDHGDHGHGRGKGREKKPKD